MSWTNFTNKECLHHIYQISAHMNSVTQEWTRHVDYLRTTWRDLSIYTEESINGNIELDVLKYLF